MGLASKRSDSERSQCFENNARNGRENARLGYSLALNRQVPSSLGRLHPKYHTPYVVMVIGSVLAIALIIPDDSELLAGLCVFGATIAFTIVHVAVLHLRERR